MQQLESFFWGIIAALGALIIELIVFIIFSVPDVSFVQLFLLPQLIIIGVFIEEVFKYIIIAKRIEMFSLSRSYIINSFFVGLGFFATEIGLALSGSALPPTNILIEIAIIHMGTAGLIGYVVAIKNPRKINTLLLALASAGFFHGAYNFLTTNRTSLLNYAILILLAFLILINIVNITRINTRLAQR